MKVSLPHSRAGLRLGLRRRSWRPPVTRGCVLCSTPIKQGRSGTRYCRHPTTLLDSLYAGFAGENPGYRKIPTMNLILCRLSSGAAAFRIHHFAKPRSEPAVGGQFNTEPACPLTVDPLAEYATPYLPREP